MERARDSIRASCSSPFSSSPSAGLPFKRRPTRLPNDGQVGLLSDAVTVPDRAARKEIERQRLRKLLNQGKKKRRRLNGDRLVISPRNGSGTTPSSHRHSREPELNPSGLPPIYADVPRKSRSVGNRRKGNSWRSIGFDPQVQLPIPSASTGVAKSSSSSVQNEIEIEFEIAEVLYGLKKQVSSSDEPLIDDLEEEENKAISVQGCSADKASSYYIVDTPKDESILMGPKLGIHNQDKVVLRQEASTAEVGSLLCSNLASDGSNLTSEVMHASMEETKNKQPEKFVIDLNEPPPMDSSLEGDGLERLNSDPKVEIKEEVQKLVTEMQLPRKMEIKDEMWDLDRGSQDDTGNESMQQFQKPQKAYSRPSHQIHMPLRTGHMMAGPLIFPLNQNQTLIDNQPGLSVIASSTENVRLKYPIGAPFLSGKGMHSSGGKSAQPVSFLDRQLHSSQTLYPIQMQPQKQHPFTTQIISSSSQRNVTRQSLYPLHSPNVAAMPSAASGGGCQWRYAEKHDLKSEEMRNSTPSLSFVSSTQCSSTDPGGLALNFSVVQSPVVSQGFLDRPNLGSQLLPAAHRLQHRSSEMIKRMNQADSILAVGNSPSFLGQSGFILKSCSAVSPASMGAKVFDTSVTTQNCKLAFAKQNALSARIQLSNSNPLGPSRDKPTSVWLQHQQQQMPQTMATSQLKGVQTVNSQHQPPFATTLSNDFPIFSENLYDKSSHSLRQ